MEIIVRKEVNRFLDKVGHILLDKIQTCHPKLWFQSDIGCLHAAKLLCVLAAHFSIHIDGGVPVGSVWAH